VDLTYGVSPCWHEPTCVSYSVTCSIKHAWLVSVTAETLRYLFQRPFSIDCLAGQCVVHKQPEFLLIRVFQAYLGEGLGLLSWLTDFKIPHPGRVAGQFVLKVRFVLRPFYNTHTHTYIHVHEHTTTQTYTQTHTHTYTRTYIHKYINIHTHIYTHTCTHMQHAYT
jgi:hypothetical protein